MAAQGASEGEWQEKWSETHQRVYYKNTVTGERQWKKPQGITGDKVVHKSRSVGHRASVDAYGVEELKKNGMFSDYTSHDQVQTSTSTGYYDYTPEQPADTTEYHTEYSSTHDYEVGAKTSSLNKLFNQTDNFESENDNLTVVITDHTGRRRSITKTDPNAPTPPPPPPLPPPSIVPKVEVSNAAPSIVPRVEASNSTPSTSPIVEGSNAAPRRSSVSRRQSMTPKQADFPLICVKCFGTDPLVPMVKVVDGKNCFFCATSFTTFSFNTQKDTRKSALIKSTQACRLCASMKDFCQVCFGPMAVNADVSDEALKQVEEVIVPILPHNKLGEIDEHHEAYVRRASISQLQPRRQSTNQYSNSNSINESPKQSTHDNSPQARRQSMNQYNKGLDSDDDTPTPNSIYPQARRQSVNKYYDGTNSNDAPPPLGTSPQARRQSVNKYYDGTNSNDAPPHSGSPQARRPSMGQPYGGSGSDVLRRLSIQHQNRRQSINNDASASNSMKEPVEVARRQSTTQQNPNITYKNTDDDSDEESKCVIT